MADMTAPDRDDVPDDVPDDWAAHAEHRMLEAAVRLAPALGWGARMATAAAREAGLEPATATLLVPNGAGDLAALLWRRHDAAALSALADVDPAALKVRERIRRAVEARVEAAAADGEAVRKASAWLSLPPHAPLALRLAWATADQLWRWAGDEAVDENHYSKRAILSALLVAVASARLSGGREAAAARLDAGLARVMAFEGWKARLPRVDAGGIAAALGRLRYGARPG